MEAMRLTTLILLFLLHASIAWSQPPKLLPELQQMRLDIQQMRLEIAATQREINYEFARVRAVVAILRDRQEQIHRVLHGERVKLWDVTP